MSCWRRWHGRTCPSCTSIRIVGVNKDDSSCRDRLCLRELIDGTFMLELCRLVRADENFTLSVLSCLLLRERPSLLEELPRSCVLRFHLLFDRQDLACSSRYGGMS